MKGPEGDPEGGPEGDPEGGPEWGPEWGPEEGVQVLSTPVCKSIVTISAKFASYRNLCPRVLEYSKTFVLLCVSLVHANFATA